MTSSPPGVVLHSQLVHCVLCGEKGVSSQRRMIATIIRIINT